jgi:hypothetical protein
MKPVSCGHSMGSYITGDLPGHPGSLERDGIQPEVVATSPVLLPRVSVDFLDWEQACESVGSTSTAYECVLSRSGS